MDKQEFEYLLRNYFRGTLSKKEERRLVDTLTENPSEDLLNLFDTVYQKTAAEMPFVDEQKKRIWENIQAEQSTAKPRNPRKIVKYAVIVLFFVLSAIGVYKIWDDREMEPQLANNTPIYLRTYTAISRVDFVENGTTKPLPNHRWQEYGLALDSNDVLTFDDRPNTESAAEATLRISTRKGQIQKIHLKGGTAIWLNSQSEIDVPISSSRYARAVQLTGEAYFEVSPRKNLPFQVTTKNNKIEVLGTHFNVISRPDRLEETTLTEGVVRVSNKDRAVLLSPGEQAIGNQQLRKRRTDVEAVLGWKTGDFFFDDLNIRELMDVVDEWYDIEFIDYRHQGSDHFSGAFKRTNSLAELLQNLEKVSSYRFELKGGGVYVLKKQM